jgi:hypothetical protein
MPQDPNPLIPQDSDPGNADPDSLVTIARYIEPFNAQLAKGMLESAGIECFLHGENANHMLSFAFRARLQVQRKDESAARELLASLGEDAAAQGDAAEALSEQEPPEGGWEPR